MAVYIDDARIRWRGRRWSHLIADTAEELYGAAAALGLRREWVQDKGRTLHYDLPDTLRERAIADGVAQPIHWRELSAWRVSARRARGGASRNSAGVLDVRRRRKGESPAGGPTGTLEHVEGWGTREA